MKKNSIRRVSLGMMNHPAEDPAREIMKAKRFGFDYIDLTLEPPGAGVETFDLRSVSKALKRTGLGVVGHTGWHLPGQAAYPEVRDGVVASLGWAARHFAALGATMMTYHIHGAAARYIGLAAGIKAQAEVLGAAAAAAEKLGLTIVLEHTSGRDDQFQILDQLFKSVPSLGFHLDLGHANLTDGGPNRLPEFLKRYGRRLRHVHFSDNRGRGDDHLPLGVGTIDWVDSIRRLKRLGYAGTVTLEVFAADEDYLLLSLKKAREWFRKIR